MTSPKRILLPIIFAVVLTALSVGAQNPRSLIGGFAADSTDQADISRVMSHLDSLASAPSPYAEAAAGLSLLLKGEEHLGLQSLGIALQRADHKSTLYDSIADYLVEYWAAKDSLGTDYEEALEGKARYLAMADSLTPDVFIELARRDVAIGNGPKARSRLAIAMTSCRTLDSLQAKEIVRLYEASADLRNDGWTLPWWGWSLLALIIIWMGLRLLFLRKTRNAFAGTEPASGAPTVLTDNEGVKSMLSLALYAVDKNRELCLLVERKLAAGQSKDLYSTMEAGKYFGKFRNSFLAEFDRSFLQAFPDFPKRLNALLKPDSGLEFGERLTPEERIAAFVSLGITGSSELAEMLGLSLNTVYTYRNRLKGRALERANFEENLAKINLEG